jgi:hypothetical protein
MEANLQLVLSYFNTKRCLVNHTIGFNNDQHVIDILAFDSQKGIIYDCDVKTYYDGRMTEAKFKAITRNLLDLKRDLKIKSLFNFNQFPGIKIQKVLILAPFVHQAEWLEKFETFSIIGYTTSDLIEALKSLKVSNQLLTNDAMLNLVKLF